MGPRLMDDSEVPLAAFRFLEDGLAPDEGLLTRKIVEERYARFRRQAG